MFGNSGAPGKPGFGLLGWKSGDFGNPANFLHLRPPGLFNFLLQTKHLFHSTQA
jgi:hypothetical protein